jgi:OPA family glycerol-3-phosphate transporter-like MFS transporter
MSFFHYFSPAAHIKPLPAEQIDSAYQKHRLQVFLGIFFGYAGYYLVRKNIALANPELVKLGLGFSKTELGFVMSALALSYGLSKFVMGTVSDRCNPRFFLVTGLVLSAAINLLIGLNPALTSSIWVMFFLMLVNGWVQGMGWPPCGRTMVHWFSTKERGTKMSIWNIAHNIGAMLIGPLAILGSSLFMLESWQSAYIVPASVALIVAAFAFAVLQDTPQSVGLPPIEEHRNDYPIEQVENVEQELTTKEILFKYVLNNRNLWYIAIANIFVYFVRYGVLDWAPTYLSEVKNFSFDKSSWAYTIYEFAGIPGTILCGWLSDRWFNGRRAPAGILFMGGVTVAVVIYWLNPAGHPLIDNLALFAIGFLIYGPVMLIGLHALDLVPKKAAGTAAGLTGLFGYIGGAVTANALMGVVVDKTGWNGGFIMLTASCLLAIFFLSLTWNAGGNKEEEITSS